nr:MAG TPA: hypothetical protein [Caudoviricetes sp.]
MDLKYLYVSSVPDLLEMYVKIADTSGNQVSKESAYEFSDCCYF